MAMAVVAFCSVGQAQGSKQEDSSTLGLGSSRAQAADTQQLSSAQRASGVADASSSVGGVTVTEAADATEATMKNGATLLLVCTLALAKKLQCRSFAVALWEAKSAGLLVCRTTEIRTSRLQ